MAYKRGYQTYSSNYSRSPRRQYTEMEKQAYRIGRVKAELEKGNPQIAASYVNGMKSVKTR